MPDRHPQTSLDELAAMVEHVIKHMATKDDVGEIVAERLKSVEQRLQAVASKIDGINRRLDSEAIQRTDLKLPLRVGELEAHVFGAARADQPQP